MGIKIRTKTADEIAKEELYASRQRAREAGLANLPLVQTPLQSTHDVRDDYPSEPKPKPAKALKKSGVKMTTAAKDKPALGGKTKTMTIRLPIEVIERLKLNVPQYTRAIADYAIDLARSEKK